MNDFSTLTLIGLLALGPQQSDQKGPGMPTIRTEPARQYSGDEHAATMGQHEMEALCPARSGNEARALRGLRRRCPRIHDHGRCGGAAATHESDGRDAQPSSHVGP